MQQFSAAQLAIIANGATLQDNTLPWRVLQAASVYTALDARYRRLVSLIGTGDLDMPGLETAFNTLYRRLDALIGTGDLDMPGLESALNGIYRRLDATIVWSSLDSASVYAALDPRYSPGATHRIRNYGATVTGVSMTLPATPLQWFDPQVFVNGLLQGPNQYTLEGDTITFSFTLADTEVQVIYAEATA